MKQFKGTKGDWFCRGDKYFVLESKNTDETVVCGYPTIATINTTFINQAEAEANKNLLVNSKLLLEALQDLVKFCKENEVGAELELAENVINKALD